MSNNQFSCQDIFEKAYINTPKASKQFIKTFLANKALNSISKNKKKLDYKNEDGTFTCPDCNKTVPQLHNAHIGPTQSYMIDDIIKNFENEEKDIIEYWNDYCDMHKYVEIAVCCSDCNTKYEDNNLSKIKMNINFIIHPEIKDEQESLNCSIDNMTLDEYKEKRKKFRFIVCEKNYDEKHTKLFKNLVLNVNTTENQKKLFVKDYELKSLFFKIGDDKLNEISVLYDNNNYQGIINILNTIDFESDLIVKEYKKTIKVKKDSVQHPFSYAQSFCNRLIDYFKSL